MNERRVLEVTNCSQEGLPGFHSHRHSAEVGLAEDCRRNDGRPAALVRGARAGCTSAASVLVKAPLPSGVEAGGTRRVGRTLW